MFCSKCGTEIPNGDICPNCGERISKNINVEKTVGELGERIKNIIVGKKIFFVLPVMLILQWILVFQPIVEVEIGWMGMTNSFTFFDMQSNNAMKMFIIALHVLAIAAMIVPMLMKQETRKLFFVPSIVASLTVAVMYIYVVSKLDTLITDTALGELIQIASVEVVLTSVSTCLILVSIIVLLLSVWMCFVKNPANPTQDENVEENNKRKENHVWKGPLFARGNIREAALVLVVICLVVSVGLMIPAILQSIFANAIVDSWHLKNSNAGDSPALVFYDDNTCKIGGYYNLGKWDIVNGKLEIITPYGEKVICSYTLSGDDLTINGNEFTRSP